MIMHYLGLDHIGHKTGPEGPNMPAKQREMDDIVKQIYTAMETKPHLKNTILIVAGDHGMNSAGNHGGSAPGETSTALLFASPKLKRIARKRPRYSAPAEPKEGTEFDFYRKIEQSDLVPTISALLGLPVPRNNLGVIAPEMLMLFHDTVAKGIENPYIQLLYRNGLQMLEIVRAAYGEHLFANVVGKTLSTAKCPKRDLPAPRLSCLWQRVQKYLLRSSMQGRAFEVDEQADVIRDVSLPSPRRPTHR